MSRATPTHKPAAGADRGGGMPFPNSILRAIEDLGYAVSTHRMVDYAEMHAVPLSGDGKVKLARCGDVGAHLSTAVAPLGTSF